MRDAEKKAAAGLVAPILHDMLNLLSAVATVAETAARQVPEGTPAARTIRELQDLIAQGKETPTRLLDDLQRHRDVEVADLTVLVARAYPLVHGAAEGAAVDLRLADEPLWVLLGSATLERILVNLVVNARDAMAEGGRITITADRSELYGCEAAVLEVADSGHGMDEEVLAHAFEPRFTTKPGLGHGLGLPTVRALAAEADGVVTIQSRPGRGTRVRVLFPLTRPPSGRWRFRREAGGRLGYR